MKIENELIRLTRVVVQLAGVCSPPDGQDSNAAREKIHLIGLSAAFFGGSHGMTQLSDACETIAPGTASVLHWLWDGIETWQA